MDFWNNVKTLIKNQRTTQEKLCKSCGISLSTFVSWIHNSRLPDVENAYKIASALNTSVEYLVTGRESDAYRLKYKTLVESLRKLAEESEEVLS